MLDLHLFSSLYSVPFQTMQTVLNIAFETLAIYVVCYVVTDFACWASRPIVSTTVATAAVNVEAKIATVVVEEVDTSSTVEEVEVEVTSTVEVVTVSGKLTVAQLKLIAKERGLKGYTKLKKVELLTLLS